MELGFFCVYKSCYLLISFINIASLPLALMFHQCIPLEKKQAGLLINGVTNLESNILKNTINGRTPWAQCNLVAHSSWNFWVHHKTFSTYEMEDKATNQDLTLYHANHLNRQAYLMLWENWHVSYHSNWVAKMVETKGCIKKQSKRRWCMKR